jgi:hypothetical protein
MKNTDLLRLSGASVLVITGEDWFAEFREDDLIRSVWHGPIEYIVGATKERLVEAMIAGYPIVHLMANFGSDYIELQDGRISVVQFRELLKLPNGSTKLLVLAGCSSFAIGKEIEDTGIACSVVATGNLEVLLADGFFRSFYKWLDHGSTPAESYSRAYTESLVHFGQEGQLPFYFSSYELGIAEVDGKLPEKLQGGSENTKVVDQSPKTLSFNAFLDREASVRGRLWTVVGVVIGLILATLALL